MLSDRQSEWTGRPQTMGRRQPRQALVGEARKALAGERPRNNWNVWNRLWPKRLENARKAIRVVAIEHPEKPEWHNIGRGGRNGRRQTPDAERVETHNAGGRDS